MGKDNFHESVDFMLVATTPPLPRDLHAVLTSLGFSSEDDFYVVDRTDQVTEWQSQDLLLVQPLLASKEIYETADDVAEGASTHWDALKLEYLLATVPESCIEPCMELVARMCAALNGGLYIDGVPILPEQLARKMRGLADDLAARSGCAPGSKDLTILIESSYPR